MTTVYFIRHAQSDRFVHDDRTRPLTAEGLADTKQITAALRDAGIAHILSSPYKRTLQTVADLADTLGLCIETDEDFRERNAGSWHGENFLEFIRQQWADFSYHIMDGECLADVQKRSIAALHRALDKYSGQVLAIATHGTALSTMLHYYDPSWQFDRFMDILDAMPYVVKLCFDETGNCLSMEEILRIDKIYQ